MDSELSRVLGYVIDDRHQEFDPIYTASTFLHKKIRLTLTAEQASLASRYLAMKSTEASDGTGRGRNPGLTF